MNKFSEQMAAYFGHDPSPLGKQEEALAVYSTEEDGQADGETMEEDIEIAEMEFPALTSMAHRIKNRDLNIIVNTINEKLMEDEMDAILHMQIKTREVSREQVRVGKITFWRMDRTNLIADIELGVDLTVSGTSGDRTVVVGMYISFWYDADEDFSCDLYEMGPIDELEERDGWKLDAYLAAIIGKDTVDTAAEEQWKIKHANALNEADERKATVLMEKYELRSEKMALYNCPAQDHILFFEEGSVLVQSTPEPGKKILPPPHYEPVKAGTIVLNTRVRGRLNDELAIYKACFEYEWFYMFFRLNDCVSTDPRGFKVRKLRYERKARKNPPCNPLTLIHSLGWKAAMGLMLPKSQTLQKWCEEIEKAKEQRMIRGYYNHGGWQNEWVVKVISEAFDVKKYLVKARLINLGKIAAKGALNYDRQKKCYLPAIAFDSMAVNARQEYFIPREELLRVYLADKDFRELMHEGVFAYVDGLVCLNDNGFIQRSGEEFHLLPTANERVDQCCLRFVRSYAGGKCRYEVDWNVFKDEHTRGFQRNLKSVAANTKGYAEKTIQRIPAKFTDTLAFMMKLCLGGRMNEAALARAADLQEKTVHQYMNDEKVERYSMDLVQLSAALKLPPYLSEKLLEKAYKMPESLDTPSIYGFILDCLYLETGKNINMYLQPNVLYSHEDEEQEYRQTA